MSVRSSGRRQVVVEQAAVEPVDALEADEAAGPHRGEQRGGVAGEAVGVGAGGLEHVQEQGVGQQAHVLGEHAEHQAVDEVGDGLGIMAAFAQALGEGDEAAGGLLGQRLAGLARPEAFGVGEGGGEQVAFGAVEQVVQREGGDLLDGVGPVGVDHDPVHVGGDQERRVLQRVLVAEELAVGGFERDAEALVLPAEAAAPPDVGPAAAAGGLARALLEGEAVVGGGGRVVDAEKRAEVVEVAVGVAALVPGRGAPLGDEVLWVSSGVAPGAAGACPAGSVAGGGGRRPASGRARPG